MTKDEFRQWWRDFAGRFPSINEWLVKLGTDVAQSQLEAWLEALANTDLRDALEVSREMSLGKCEPIGSFSSERERTGVYIARAAQRLRERREQSSNRSDAGASWRPARRETAAPRDRFRDIVTRMVRLIDGGRSLEEAKAACAAAIAAAPGRNVTYSCLACEDTGTVCCWSWRAVQAWREDPALIECSANRSTMAVPCSCSAGDKFMGDDRRKGCWQNQEIRYDPREYCLVIGGDVKSDTALAEFRLWCRAFFERIDTARAARMRDEGSF